MSALSQNFTAPTNVSRPTQRSAPKKSAPRSDEHGSGSGTREREIKGVTLKKSKAIDSMRMNSTIPPPLGSVDRRNYESTDEDWDMPRNTVDNSTALNWQQQQLATTIPKPSRRANSTSSKPIRRPKIKETISDPTLPASNLNWQEQLSTSSLPPSNSNSNLKQFQSLQPASPRNNPPKSKSKSISNSHSNSQKDLETFGQSFSSLSLSFTEESSSRRPKSSGPPSTPKASESRYAGPTFHNSPDPTSLPIPAFLLKRTAGAVSS